MIEPLSKEPKMNKILPGKGTSEHNTLVGWLIRNTILLIVWLGWLTPDVGEALGPAIFQVLGILGVVGAEALGVNGYTKARTNLKQRELENGGQQTD